MEICPICSSTDFIQKEIIKQRLINEWQLSSFEVKYINKQQGLLCKNCYCSLRSMTLADAIMNHYSYKNNFKKFCKSKYSKRLKLLEINTAGCLHPFLREFRDYVFAEYPNVDIQKLPYENDCFDLVIHSDTLEHIENSLLALKECKRILTIGGVLFYTIPIIYGRLTRRRDGLSNSYHGKQDESQGIDYKVYTEYGADFWVEVFRSGFSSVTLSILEDLSSIAIRAIKYQ